MMRYIEYLLLFLNCENGTISIKLTYASENNNN